MRGMILSSLIILQSWACFGGLPMEISAKVLHYDGQIAHLSGDVQLKHPAGTILCGKAVLTPDPKDPILGVPSILATGNVQILLEDGKSLHCSKAYFDRQKLSAKFGDFDPCYLSFPDQDLQIQCHNLDLFFEKTGSYHLTRAVAKEKVLLKYGDDFRGVCDRAQLANPDSPVLQLSAQGPLGNCVMSHSEGHWVEAEEFEIHLDEKRVHAWIPTGTLIREGKEYTFSARRAILEEEKGLMFLQQNVNIGLPSKQNYATDGCLEIHLQHVEGEWKPYLAIADGFNQLNHLRTDGKEAQLSCHGQVHVDISDEGAVIRAETYADDDGQVLFQDPIGTARGDRLSIALDAQTEPTKVLLEGRTSLERKACLDSFGPDMEGLQYALADVVEYCPSKEALILHAKEGERILFFDQGTGLQMTAEKITIDQALIPDKATVKGQGNVRFSLEDVEWSKLSTKFDLG